jgi:cytosine/adenosine deaminase-related metal-dependent hydrolase
VWPVSVVVGDVLGQHTFEVPATEDQHAVEALTADGADEALGEGVGSGSSHRSADDADAVSSEDLIEARGELGVPVTDQELDGNDPVPQHHGQVALLP